MKHISQLAAVPGPPANDSPNPQPDGLTRESIRAIDTGIVSERLAFLDGLIAVLQQFRRSRFPRETTIPLAEDIDSALLALFHVRARLVDMLREIREAP
jgi:hypothetical protein